MLTFNFWFNVCFFNLVFYICSSLFGQDCSILEHKYCSNSDFGSFIHPFSLICMFSGKAVRLAHFHSCFVALLSLPIMFVLSSQHKGPNYTCRKLISSLLQPPPMHVAGRRDSDWRMPPHTLLRLPLATADHRLDAECIYIPGGAPSSSSSLSIHIIYISLISPVRSLSALWPTENPFEQIPPILKNRSASPSGRLCHYRFTDSRYQWSVFWLTPSHPSACRSISTSPPINPLRNCVRSDKHEHGMCKTHVSQAKSSLCSCR